MRVFLVGMAFGVLAACAPAVPDSGAGVGFDRVDRDRAARQARDQQLEAAAPVSTTALDATGGDDDLAAARRALADNSGVAPVQASPDNPPPPAVTNSAGLSREQDFQAVSGQRTIESDAERIASAQSQYQVVAPTDLPEREGNNTPNIVAFALQTTNPVGTPIYKRSGTSEAKHQRSCAGFASPDLAQEEFLSSGGPEKDRKGLDPDGDGFACGWDPTPFRRVRSN